MHASHPERPSQQTHSHKPRQHTHPSPRASPKHITNHAPSHNKPRPNVPSTRNHPIHSRLVRPRPRHHAILPTRQNRHTTSSRSPSPLRPTHHHHPRSLRSAHLGHHRPTNQPLVRLHTKTPIRRKIRHQHHTRWHHLLDFPNPSHHRQTNTRRPYNHPIHHPQKRIHHRHRKAHHNRRTIQTSPPTTPRPPSNRKITHQDSRHWPMDSQLRPDALPPLPKCLPNRRHRPYQRHQTRTTDGAETHKTRNFKTRYKLEKPRGLCHFLFMAYTILNPIMLHKRHVLYNYLFVESVILNLELWYVAILDFLLCNF